MIYFIVWWKSKCEHLNDFIFWNLDVLNSSSLPRRCTNDNSMKILDVFHLNIVWNSAHSDQELVLGDLVGAFLCKFIEDYWKVDALLVVCYPRVLPQLINRFSVLIWKLWNSILDLSSHSIDQMWSSSILIVLAFSIKISFLNNLQKL